MQKQKGPLLFKKNLQFISQNLKDLDEAKIKFMHMFPSNLNVQVGDYVVAAECRPISKSVSFVVVEVKS